jgi:hypothetical protein
LYSRISGYGIVQVDLAEDNELIGHDLGLEFVALGIKKVQALSYVPQVHIPPVSQCGSIHRLAPGDSD